MKPKFKNHQRVYCGIVKSWGTVIGISNENPRRVVVSFDCRNPLYSGVLSYTLEGAMFEKGLVTLSDKEYDIKFVSDGSDLSDVNIKTPKVGNVNIKTPKVGNDYINHASEVLILDRKGEDYNLGFLMVNGLLVYYANPLILSSGRYLR